MDIQLEVTATITLLVILFASAILVTKYITQLQFSVREERSSHALKNLEQKYNDLKTKYDVLYDEVKRTQLIGARSLSKKLEIDDCLAQIMKSVRATAGSVYIPLVEDSSAKAKVEYLLFLSILPMNEESQSLRRKPIPLASFAGRCYTTGQPSLILNAKSNKEHFSAADQIAGFDTESLLNIPLQHKGKVIGVIQLLNKAQSYQFDEKDLELVKHSAEAMSLMVAEFLAIPDRIQPWLLS